MKYFIKTTCLLFILTGIANIALAQNQYKIYGTVADSASRKPLDYITISLKSADNVALKATLTKNGGTFNFDGLPAAKYNLAIVAIGYQTRFMDAVLTDSTNKTINLGTIYIAQQIKDLKGVTITADRPVIKQQADRIIYDLQADPESKGNNVLTMMRKVPFVSMDANDNLLLKGNSSFKVLINGKPSGMADNNLKAVLQSMPASTIQSIEVITNPPAKYDAEGLAGIINIITNKKLDRGFKGTLNANESFPKGGPGVGTSFSLKQGKFGATGYGGASIYNTPNTEYTSSRSTTGVNASTLTQNGSSNFKNKEAYFGTELSYDIDSLNLLSAQFNISGSKGDGESGQTTVLSNQAATLQSYSLANANNSDGKGFDAGINYQLGFKGDKSKLLTLAYSYNNYNNSQYNNISILNPVNYPAPNYQQNNHTNNNENTFQLDYVQQVKQLYIEGGVKAILRNSSSNFDYLAFDPASNQFEIDADFSDRFNYTQDVYGAYNSYRYSLNSWSFNGGVRVEETLINANFIASNTRVDQNFFNVIPNLSINKEFKNKSSLSIGFNQRIKRPNIRRFNPFVDRSNPNAVTTGNPNLKPVIQNNVQLTYNNNKKLAVTASVGYGYINNMDLRISTLDPLTNITYTTYQNTGRATRMGLDYNLSYPITNQWNIGANGNVQYFRVSGMVGTTIVRVNKADAYISASSGYKLEKGWRLNANVMYRTRAITDLQSTGNAITTSSFSVNKELIKNKLSFAASLNNPFAKYRSSINNTFGPDFIQVNNTQEYYRSVNLSLNYNFGQLKSDIRKGQRGINNDDVSK